MNRGWKTLRLLLLAMLCVGATALAQKNTSVLQLPPIKSPVDTFRELLNLSPTERVQMLTNRPAPARERLLEKLREYQALSPDARELRLRATELRWWLLPLMRLPAANRTNWLSQVPAHLRPLVLQRLEIWDLNPPPLQQELLENEDIAQLFLQIKDRTPAQREIILQNLLPERRRLLEKGLERWPAMPDERRQNCERFDRYFELSERERAKVLSTISETEKQQMAQTLRAFEKLPRDKRIVCVRSFEKFASMEIAERQQFLLNAERWEKMSPAERQAWRNLVSRVPEYPPLPPGSGEALPPLPPGVPRSPVPPTTNGGG